MDMIDGRIYTLQEIKLASDMYFGLCEQRGNRQKVSIYLTSGGDSAARYSVSMDDLTAMIRMLTTAKERLEAFGSLDGLEKIVP